ncbi:MAG: amidohydrolase family protein [Asticcacaulis sp.]
MTLSRFVDAHVHLWKLDHLRYPWLMPPFSDVGPNGSVEPIAQDYLLADYLRDATGFPVEKIIHIDAGAHPDDALSETRWLQSLADTDGFPQAIVAFAALNDPNVETLLAAHVESRNVRGIRHILNWHPDPNRTYTPRNLLEDEAFAKGYALLGKYNLSFDLQIYPNQMAQAYQLAQRHPDIPVILNHMGMPVDQDADGLLRWKDGLKLLAQLPHVAVKISGLGFIDRQWTPQAMRPPVLETIDRFGAERCAFASDFPTDKLFKTYDKALNFYDELTLDFSPTERDALFAANAERIYRI